MKILVASDLHGSRQNGEKLLAAFKREGADQLLLLGDLLAHGETAGALLEDDLAVLLNEYKDKILCVRGNGEWDSDQSRLDFPCLTEWQVLREGGYTIFATHGHLYHEQRLPPIPFDVLLHGHSHVPALREHADYVHMNPGAVSRPRGGSTHSYMLIEEDKYSWKDLAGEVFRSYQMPKQ